MSDHLDFQQRRALITGAAVLGAGLAAVQPAEAAPAAWTPALEKQDDWMDMPAAHRFVFDCISPEGAASTLGFCRNFYDFSKSGYGLEPSSSAVVIILRSRATMFGYNDVVWAKYGAILSDAAKLIDPATKAAPVRNIYNVKGLRGGEGGGVTLSDLIDHGARFAICGAATQGITNNLAKTTGGKAENIHAELAANLIPNARLVPAGIIALNRTQERGYAVAHIG
jgi:hypothetical protein